MKNIKILATRTVYNGGKQITFTNGEYCTMAKIRKGGFVTLPAWAVQANPTEGLIDANNRQIDRLNQEGFKAEDCTEVELLQVELVKEHLDTLGFTKPEFTFVRGASKAFKGSDTETVWIGVKLDKMAGAFVRDTGKRVSFANHNFISITTFLRRVENGGQLFLG